MRRVQLSEITKFIRNGKSIKNSSDGAGLPITRIETISDGIVNESKLGYGGVKDISKIRDYWLEDGDILMSHINSPKHLGKTALYRKNDLDIIHGMNLLGIRPIESKVQPAYLNYYFLSKDFDSFIKSISNQSVNQASFAASKLKKLKIPLPCLSEQKAIVAKLDRAQRLIDIDREMLAKYDELIQSVFLEMFGDPVTNPKGLKEKDFGELVDITGGYAFKSKNFLDDESGVKVVKIANVHFIDLDWSEVQYLPMESLKEHENYSLKEGDILLALTRPIINSLDAVKAVVVKESDLPALLNQRVARIRVDSDEVTEDYITSFIYTQHFKRQIEKYASTSLQPNVSNKEVSKIKVLVPEIDQQRKFSEIRQRILNERDALEMNQRKSEELFSSLVQGAFG